MTERYNIACDLGAESGRVILGSLCNRKLTLTEIHRFPTGADKIDGTWRWNLPRLFDELKTGLGIVAERGVPVSGISVNSWGVDYALSSDEEPIVSPAYQYRDSRTVKTFPAAVEKYGAQKLFEETGIQPQFYNTLYQLIAEVAENPELIEKSDRFLTIADYFNYRFSGVAREEVSLASTTQLYNPHTRDWSAEVIREFGLPQKLFAPLVSSGTRLGPLTQELQSETKLPAVEVIATCSHDTGAAVAAVPAAGDDWAFLSSGTWSLLGVELPEPIITEAVREQGFTNEAGYGGSTRLLKNIIGLWLLQESRREWASQGQELDYSDISCQAEDAEPFRSLIDPNAERFVKPGDMPGQIAAYCRETNQPVPETVGQVARCILESLALLYRQSIDGLAELSGRKISKLHIVGGGSKNVVLNQFSANASGRTVIAGPAEATAIGNLLIQSVALGDIESLAELRQVVRDSFSIETFQSQQSGEWEQAFQRFGALDLKT
jgi:rhamnulokinase